MISRLLLFFLICVSGFLPAQTIISELARLDTIPDATERASITTKLLLRFLPGKAPASAEALLAEYDDNPYLSVLLRAPGIRDTILTFNLESIIKEVQQEDLETGRMRYRRVYNRSDIFNNERNLDLRWLAEEYAAPSPLVLDRLPSQALRAQESSGATDYSSMVLASLADWIQKRAQEEFTVTFMGKLKDKIREKNLQHLFPATAKLLLNVDVADYRTFLPDARVAFAKDLQTITFNFAEFLRCSKAIDTNDARLLNLLLVYELLDLSARGLQLPEILAYARGQLNERRFAAEQRIHLQLADSLRSNTREADQLIKEYDNVVLAFRNAGITLLDDATTFDGKLKTLAKSQGTAQINIDTQRFNRLPIVSNSSFNTMFDNEDRHFGQATDLLRGEAPYNYWLANPSIDSFNILFLTDSLPASDTLRAMGLTMVNAFLQKDSKGEFRVFNRLAKTAHSLDLWQAKYDSIQMVLNRPTSLNRAFVLSQATALSAKISASKAFWNDNLPQVERRDKSFEYLANLAGDYINKGTVEPRAARFPIQLAYLQRVDSTYKDYINKLESANTLLTDPVNLSSSVDPTHYDSLKLLRHKFEQLEKTYTTFKNRSAAKELESYKNTQNFEQLLSVSAELMYFLSSPKQDSFVRAKDMASSLIEPKNRQLFQGLLYQRVAQQPAFGPPLSPRGLADLGTDFSIALGQLYEPSPQDSLTTKLGRYLNFLTTVMNDVLEAPLLNNPNGIKPLTSRDGLKKIPSINRRINDLYSLTSTGKYRQAIVPLLDLVELFNVIPDSTNRLKNLTKKVDDQQKIVVIYGAPQNDTKEQKKEREKLKTFQLKKDRVSGTILRKFRRYAGFGAALATAERPSDISAVLDAAAMPAGSSRNKRLYRFNVDLNAYFGGAYGRDFLLNTPDSISSRATTFGMFVPVGASVTWKLSQRREWSVSLFFPILDLGAITAYRSGENASTVPEVSFQNVLAPGAHFLLNFPRSPFFIGGGIQYGPNERTIGEQNYSAFRLLGTFGIDVPILNFARSEH